MNKKRPYRVINEDTGAEHMVLAISQAQALSYLARNQFTVTAASGMDVAAHAMKGGVIEDAGDRDDQMPLPIPPADATKKPDSDDFTQHLANGIEGHAAALGDGDDD